MIQRRKNFLVGLFASQKFLALLGLIILLLILFPMVKNFNHRREINNEISDLEKEINTVKNRNNDLNKLVGYLQSNQFVEEKARLNFGLKKNGEEVAIIKTGDDGVSSSERAIFNMPGAENSQAIKPVINPERWKKYFFN